MTYDACLPPEQRKLSLRTDLKCVAGALALLLLFALGYGGIVAAFLQQGAPLAQPGDRLLVMFPPRTEIPLALEQLAAAGAALSGSGGMPWFYSVEVISPGAGGQLANDTWALRLPRQPTLASCFGMVSDGG